MSCNCEVPAADAAAQAAMADASCCPSAFCSDKLLSLPEATRMNIVGVRSGSKCLNVFPRTRTGFVIYDGKGGGIVTSQPQVPIPYLRTLLYDGSGQPIIAETGNPEEADPPGVDSLVVSGACGLQWRYRGRAGYRQRLVWDGCKWVVENDNNKELDDYPSVYDGREDCDYLPMVLVKQEDGTYRMGYRSTHFRVPGEIIAYGGTLAGVPAEFLPCDGSSYDTSLYPRLYAAIGYKWGNDGGMFRVPDLRGYFLRGVDHGEGVDENAGGRTAKFAGGASGDSVGSYQTDAFQCHEHMLPSGTSSGTDTVIVYDTTGTLAAGDNDETQGVIDGDCGTIRTADETRPKNANVEYIIYAGCRDD